MSIHSLALTGGVFAVLAFWHFFADWVFQSHKEALAKSTDWVVRLRHCLVYTVLFVPLFWLVGFRGIKETFALLLLLTSHFIIDTYIPVMLWAKYLRLAPQFAQVGVRQPPQGWQDKVVEPVTFNGDVEAFKAFFATNVGAILCITMDQFLHIGFLLPIAWLMVH